MHTAYGEKKEYKYYVTQYIVFGLLGNAANFLARGYFPQRGQHCCKLVSCSHGQVDQHSDGSCHGLGPCGPCRGNCQTVHDDTSAILCTVLPGGLVSIPARALMSSSTHATASSFPGSQPWLEICPLSSLCTDTHYGILSVIMIYIFFYVGWVFLPCTC